MLPLPAPLVPLFPDGALRRGATTLVTGAPGRGATTLALALLAAASTGAGWCGAVGLADPGVVAMVELGIDLRRVVFVPHPQAGWADAAAELADGVDVVLVRPPGRARPTAARHLVARARQRQVALVVLVDRAQEWPEGPDAALTVTGAEWYGIGRGHGHLQGRRAEVQVTGRRSGRPGGDPHPVAPHRHRHRRRGRRRRPGPGPGGGTVSRSGVTGEGVERLVVVWCPTLVAEGERGEEARQFLAVLAAVEASAPGWSRSAWGCAPCRPAGRPGSSAVSRRWSSSWPPRSPEVLGGAEAVRVGVADGLFAGAAGGPGRRWSSNPAAPPTSSPRGRSRCCAVRTWRPPCGASGSTPSASSPTSPARTSWPASGRTPPPATGWPGGRTGELAGLRDPGSTGACGWPGAR